MCAALGDDISQSLDISSAIEYPELRIAYLLSAYELLKPMPKSLSEWPLYRWRPSVVVIERKTNK
jgi:hypothetical protein